MGCCMQVYLTWPCSQALATICAQSATHAMCSLPPVVCAHCHSHMDGTALTFKPAVQQRGAQDVHHPYRKLHHFPQLVCVKKLSRKCSGCIWLQYSPSQARGLLRAVVPSWPRSQALAAGSALGPPTVWAHCLCSLPPMVCAYCLFSFHPPSVCPIPPTICALRVCTHCHPHGRYCFDFWIGIPRAYATIQWRVAQDVHHELVERRHASLCPPFPPLGKSKPNSCERLLIHVCVCVCAAHHAGSYCRWPSPPFINRSTPVAVVLTLEDGTRMKALECCRISTKVCKEENLVGKW